MGSTVYAIAHTEAQAVQAAERLRVHGILPDDISILSPDRSGVHAVGHTNSTKSPEGASVGAGAGLLTGGLVGWMAGIGALAIPGLGPLIAAGPILAALSGAALGSAVGGLAGGLMGLGIPEYEAKQYEGRLQEGKILIAAFVRDSTKVADIRKIYEEEGLEDISTGSPEKSPQPETRR